MLIIVYQLAASRWGQDKRGRRRSATIPPNQLSRENVSNILHNVVKCDEILQNVSKCGNLCALKLWRKAAR